MRLVKALAKLYGPLVNREIDPLTEVLVTGGAYGALYYSIMSNVGKGDEVFTKFTNINYDFNAYG